MSLNPSNLIAARDSPGRTMFPNLARHYEEGADCSDVDAQVLAELTAAGIPASGPAEFLRRNKEVPAAYLGELCGWRFDRAWYYWIAKGPGIPCDRAMELWRSPDGKAVRVDGHCAAPSPEEWFHGFAVGHYHVDTAEGLAALASLLKAIYVPGKES